MNQLCELLPWDSAFFGFPIGRVVSAKLDPAAVQEIKNWCCRESARCLYLLADAGCPLTAHCAAAAGFQFVDVRVTLNCPAAHIVPRSPAEFTIRDPLATDVPILQRIARDSHGDTRFFFDPHFDRDRAKELYATWIRRDCEGRAGRVFVAASPESVPTGYISCSVNSGTGVGELGLLGVASESRGRGLGSILVAAATQWLVRAGAKEIRVVTQGRNVPAQRLYQAMGFRTHGTGIWFHLWREASAPDSGGPVRTQAGL
jgi:dTDP-4-amino-4,6-dideoxy-D-galactose acyltransferase